MASRNWCFTINNPEPEEYPDQWSNLSNLKAGVFQMELGEEGTVHLQGYVELNNPRQLQWLRRNLSARAHWEKRRGSRKQAFEYCMKEETRLGFPSFFGSIGENQACWHQAEDGTNAGLESLLSELNIKLTESQCPSNSVNSKKLLEIKQKLDDGCSLETISDEYFPLWVRYWRSFEKYLTTKTAPRTHACEVHVLFGPTGTGKSKWCLDNFPDAYWKQRSKWWDGYAGQSVVILDEYYGWLQYDTLLRLCDRYPLLVESKGGQLQFVAKCIVFTTNKLPDEWYSNCYFPALERRVTKWHYMPSLGIHSIFTNFSEFKSVVQNRV